MTASAGAWASEATVVTVVVTVETIAKPSQWRTGPVYHRLRQEHLTTNLQVGI